MDSQEQEDELVTLIVQLYEQIKTSAVVIEICSKNFGDLGWNVQKEAEKADAAFEKAEGDEETRRAQIQALCEVLDDQRPVLEQYLRKVESRKALIMKKFFVMSALNRTDRLLTKAEQLISEIAFNREARN